MKKTVALRAVAAVVLLAVNMLEQKQKGKTR